LLLRWSARPPPLASLWAVMTTPETANKTMTAIEEIQAFMTNLDVVAFLVRL
jgi:hypothetical protein